MDKICKKCMYFRYLVTKHHILDGCRCIMFGNDVEIDEDTEANDCEEYKEDESFKSR